MVMSCAFYITFTFDIAPDIVVDYTMSMFLFSILDEKKSELLNNEILSTFLEDFILVWCLEKISPDLPSQV